LNWALKARYPDGRGRFLPVSVSADHKQLLEFPGKTRRYGQVAAAKSRIAWDFQAQMRVAKNKGWGSGPKSANSRGETTTAVVKPPANDARKGSSHANPNANQSKPCEFRRKLFAM
jgi:hypothetical protein